MVRLIRRWVLLRRRSSCRLLGGRIGVVDRAWSIVVFD